MVGTGFAFFAAFRRLEVDCEDLRMTFMFSGVGMSRMVSEWIGEIPNSIGFVLPTYGWRVPKLARRIIASRKNELSQRDVFTWAVFTCGDDTGFIDRDLEGLLGRRLDAVGLPRAGGQAPLALHIVGETL